MVILYWQQENVWVFFIVNVIKNLQVQVNLYGSDMEKNILSK